MDAVVHVAARPNIWSGQGHEIIHTNVTGTWNVLQAAEEAGVKRVILTSSNSVIGYTVLQGAMLPPDYLPVDEAHPRRPTDAYAISKKLCEELGRSFEERGKLEVVVLRPVYVLYPEFEGEVKARAANPTSYKGPEAGGRQPAGGGVMWHYVDPRDLARAYRLALEADKPGFGPYFICGRTTLAPEPTIERLAARMGRRIPVKRPEVYAENPHAPLYDLTRPRAAGLRRRARHAQPALSREIVVTVFHTAHLRAKPDAVEQYKARLLQHARNSLELREGRLPALRRAPGQAGPDAVPADRDLSRRGGLRGASQLGALRRPTSRIRKTGWRSGRGGTGPRCLCRLPDMETTMTGQPASRFLPVDLTGSRVVVTAAATGIGYAIAEAFLSRGARVAICDINREALDKAAKSLPGALVRTSTWPAPDAVADFFAAVDKEMGGVDVLVNNAGIAGPTANVEDVTPEALAETLDINVAGQFYAARHVTPGMKARRKGCIINLSSIAGRLAFAMRSPYAASKWAVVGFTKSLAAELGEFDITVNAILPGHVRTERFSRVVAAKARAVGVPEEQMRRAYLEPVSLKRNVEMDDIANMALYLASPFGRNITGQALSVCGDVRYVQTSHAGRVSVRTPRSGGSRSGIASGCTVYRMP